MASLQIAELSAVALDSARAQLRAGLVNVVIFPDNIPTEVINYVAGTLSNDFKMKYVAVYNADTMVYALRPLAHVEGKKNLEASSARIPRPPNAFIIYRAAQHKELKARHPGISNSEISKTVSEQWRSMTAEEIQVWKDKASEAKRNHASKYPNYVYSPRKASDKRKNKELKMFLANKDILNNQDPALLAARLDANLASGFLDLSADKVIKGQALGNVMDANNNLTTEALLSRQFLADTTFHVLPRVNNAARQIIHANAAGPHPVPANNVQISPTMIEARLPELIIKAHPNDDIANVQPLYEDGFYDFSNIHTTADTDFSALLESIYQAEENSL